MSREGKVSQGRKKADPQTKMPASLSISGVDTNPDVEGGGWQELQSHTERRKWGPLDFMQGGQVEASESFFWNLKSPCNYPQPEHSEVLGFSSS